MKTEESIAIGVFIFIVLSIGTLSFLTSKPTTTGLVTYESIGQREPNFALGVYSVYPHLSTSFDFDLNIYQDLQQDLSEIIECAAEGNTIQTCLLPHEHSGRDWVLGCDSPDETFFYEFVEFYRDCVNSEDSQCYCEKDFDNQVEIQTKKFNGDHTLNFEKERNTVKISNTQVQENIISDYTIGQRFPSQLSFSYDLNRLRTVAAQYDQQVPLPNNKFVLYKGPTQMDVLSIDTDYLFYPDPSQPDLFSQQPKSQMNKCILPQKNIQKFCVNLSKPVVVFEDDQLVSKDLTVKFAAHIPDLPPSPVEGIEVLDLAKNDDHLIVKWKEHEEEDVASYSVYYSPSSLQSFSVGRDIGDIKRSVSSQSYDVDIDPLNILHASIDLTQCQFNRNDKQCYYSYDGREVTLDTQTLYYLALSQEYVVILPTPTGEIDVSVTAIDVNNNEINNIQEGQELPIAKGTIIDDMPPESKDLVRLLSPLPYDEDTKRITFPSYTLPTQNIDGTPIDGDEEFVVYYHVSSESPTEEWTLQEFKNAFGGTVNEFVQGNQFVIDLSAFSPVPGEHYYFVVLYLDPFIDREHFEEIFTIKELGTKPLHLVIPQ